jgi:hypothetical protein
LEFWKGSSILQSEISTAPRFEHRHTTPPVDAAAATIHIPFARAADTGMERRRSPLRVRNGQGGGAGIADPLTISRSAATLSDTWVGRVGGKALTDPEPSDLGLCNIKPSNSWQNEFGRLGACMRIIFSARRR